MLGIYIHYPKAKKITLVMNNFKTHVASAFYETCEPIEAVQPPRTLYDGKSGNPDWESLVMFKRN